MAYPILSLAPELLAATTTFNLPYIANMFPTDHTPITPPLESLKEALEEIILHTRPRAAYFDDPDSDLPLRGF